MTKRKKISHDMIGAGDTGDPRQTTVPAASTGRALGLVMLAPSYSVISWSPDGAARLPPEAVILLLPIELEDQPLPPIGLRLKSRSATDDLISALVAHRDDVWPRPMSDEEAMAILMARCEYINIEPLERRIHILITGSTNTVMVAAEEGETMTDVLRAAAQGLTRGWPPEWGEAPPGYLAARETKRAGDGGPTSES